MWSLKILLFYPAQAQSRQMALRTQKMPSECASAFSSSSEAGETNSGYFDRISRSFSSVVHAISSPFRFADDTDVCQKYHDAYHVDVITEVSPMKAITQTVNQMALEPAEMIGHAIGRFIHGKLLFDFYLHRSFVISD